MWSARLTSSLVPSELFSTSLLLQFALVAGAVTVGGGVFLIWALPDYTERLTDRIRASPVEALVHGVVMVVAAAVISGLLLLSFVGFPAAIILSVAVVAAVTLGAALAFYALGRALVGQVAPGREDAALLLGAAVATVVALVPVLGIAVAVVVGTVGAGAMLAAFLDEPTLDA